LHITSYESTAFGPKWCINLSTYGIVLSENKKTPTRGDGDNVVSAEKFEEFLVEEYGDDEIGGIEEEDIEGPMALENIEDVLDEYLQEQVECCWPET
jgi:hypothetical protein